ncbi:hypothetical protein F5883DRAFT_92595 [Diaporthe sp. PMI_573]|nr:hypothetical protein F5883DRAFT_92595 [Diaporthaceae sp. PMI_573]
MGCRASWCSAPHTRAACLAPRLSLSEDPPLVLGLMLATTEIACVLACGILGWGLGLPPGCLPRNTLQMILHLGRRPNRPRYVIPGPGPVCKPVTEATQAVWPVSLSGLSGRLAVGSPGLPSCHRRSSDLPRGGRSGGRVMSWDLCGTAVVAQAWRRWDGTALTRWSCCLWCGRPMTALSRLLGHWIWIGIVSGSL